MDESAKVLKHEITDSRGVKWDTTVSGPVKAGTMKEGGNLDDLPDHYMIRFRRTDTGGQIEVEGHTTDYSADELRALLEEQPEWEYSDV